MKSSIAGLDPAALVPGDELDPTFLVTSEDPLAEIAELCYIPTFGGGFAFSPAEVEKWPVSRKRRMLEWLRERRETEAKALGGKSGASGRTGWTPPPGLPRGPSLSGPARP